MAFVEGDRFKHKLAGQLYVLKVIKDDTIVLESEDTPYRMWFGEADLDLFFRDGREKKKELKKVLMRPWGHIQRGIELNLYGMKGGESKGVNGQRSNGQATPPS
jgi:hypothetical protein